MDTGWEIAGVIAEAVAAAATLGAVVWALVSARREHDHATQSLDIARRSLDVAERDQTLRLGAALSIEGRWRERREAESDVVPWELAVTNRGQHEARDVRLSVDAAAHPLGNRPYMGHYQEIDGAGQRPTVDYLAPGQTVVMSRGQCIGDDFTAYVRITWSDGIGQHDELRKVPLQSD